MTVAEIVRFIPLYYEADDKTESSRSDGEAAFSQVLQQEGRPIYGQQALVTVTNVYMSPDLGIAKIYLSIFNVENKQEIVILLEKETKILKQRLSQRLKKHVRRVPEIRLFMDDTLDEMYHLSTVFDKLRADNQMGKGEEE